jgi:hypothetical protein
MENEFQLKDATTLYCLPSSSGPTKLEAESNDPQKIGKWTAENLVRSHEVPGLWNDHVITPSEGTA